MLKEALLYKKLQDKKVSCFLCAHRCLIDDGEAGICKVRHNKAGLLYTSAFGEVVAANPDPIEKKPIFHILPGTKSFSIAAAGCNFRCWFCQNWQISQKEEAGKPGQAAYPMDADKAVSLALEYNCKSISYTYTEPTIFFEYALDIAVKAMEKGLSNIFVTNGYMSKEALKMISPYLSAANVDLKFYSDESYHKVCAGRLEPVLDSIRLMRELKVWVEVTTLVVPSLNDSEQELEAIANFIAATGKEIPWHISRFHPDYKMQSAQPTPMSKLNEAYDIGKGAGLRYVYVGNVLDEGKTFCYNCGKVLITRVGFSVEQNHIKGGKCPFCQAVIDGVF